MRTPQQIDALILRLQELDEEIKALKEARAEVALQFGPGRTEGSKLAVFVKGRRMRSRYSARLLKEHVPARTLDLCRVNTLAGPTISIVPKLKPKKQKG